METIVLDIKEFDYLNGNDKLTIYLSQSANIEMGDTVKICYVYSHNIYMSNTLTHAVVIGIESLVVSGFARLLKVTLRSCNIDEMGLINSTL